MASYDPKLGTAIHALLVQKGIETPFSKRVETDLQNDLSLQQAIVTMVASLGATMDDDSIKNTPKRIHKMYTQEIFYGLDYKKFPECSTFENKMGYDEVIMCRKIQVCSVCEHHFVPFIGYANIGYIPAKEGGKVIGLSKMNRVVDFFSRRPQVQERLTEQVSAALQFILKTEDVAVVIQAKHLCVQMRGVKDANSDTVTSKLSGRFKSVPALRQEFFALSGK